MSRVHRCGFLSLLLPSFPSVVLFLGIVQCTHVHMFVSSHAVMICCFILSILFYSWCHVDGGWCSSDHCPWCFEIADNKEASFFGTLEQYHDRCNTHSTALQYDGHPVKCYNSPSEEAGVIWHQNVDLITKMNDQTHRNVSSGQLLLSLCMDLLECIEDFAMRMNVSWCPLLYDLLLTKCVRHST